MIQRIVCAALKNELGEVICGARHFDKVMIAQIKISGRSYVSAGQGFIDQYGDFYDREQSWEIAVKADQIVRRVPGDEGKLFSENLY